MRPQEWEFNLIGLVSSFSPQGHSKKVMSSSQEEGLVRNLIDCT